MELTARGRQFSLIATSLSAPGFPAIAANMGHVAGFFMIELFQMWHHCTGGFT